MEGQHTAARFCSVECKADMPSNKIKTGRRAGGKQKQSDINPKFLVRGKISDCNRGCIISNEA